MSAPWDSPSRNPLEHPWKKPILAPPNNTTYISNSFYIYIFVLILFFLFGFVLFTARSYIRQRTGQHFASTHLEMGGYNDEEPKEDGLTTHDEKKKNNKEKKNKNKRNKRKKIN